jgi:hypothetical protein
MSRDRTKSAAPNLWAPPQNPSEKAQAEGLFQGAVEQAKRLSGVDPQIARFLSYSGLDDGVSSEDKVAVKKATLPAGRLKPSQTTIKAWATVGMALGMLLKGRVGGNLGALISKDGHILDGHHRWAATVLAGGPGAKVGGWVADLPGHELIKVLNIMTNGVYGRSRGNKGTGNISDVNPRKIRALLEDYVANGIRDKKHPLSAGKVREALKRGFGSVEEGIKQMSANAAKVSKQVPSWAPARSDMPIVEGEEAGQAAKLLNQGKVNWKAPFTQELGSARAASRNLTASDRTRLIRLASTMPKGSPERRAILVGLRKIDDRS